MKFLWECGYDKHKIPWIKWETMCKPREEGGFDIRDIEKFNTTLLTKWKWRLGVEKQ